MASTVAIDFGTSRTKLAYWDPISHRPQLMRFQRDEPFLPSLFYLALASEQILWGHEAEEMLHDDPAGVVAVLKRQLRQRYVRANRRRAEPGKLLTVLLTHLRKQAGEQVAALAGQSPTAVQLTLPALYGPTEEGILRVAATEAGFEDIEVVSEPVAAARAWLAETQDASQEVVVLDCGGGTSDWAYLCRQGEDFQLVSHCPPGGDTAVGGHDVDLELVELVKERLEEEAASELEDQTVYYLQQVRILKERYCRGLAGRPLKIGGRSIELEEKEIQAVIEARFVTQVCEGLKGYLAKVKEATGRALPTVLLVGGSARLKGLREAIEARLECQTAWWERSEYATALGAVPIPQAPLGLAKEEAADIERVVVGSTRATTLERSKPPRVSSPLTVLPSRVVRTLSGHTNWVCSVAFSPDGQWLASGSTDKTVKLWEVASGRELRTLSEHTDWVNSVAFSPNGRLLASGGSFPDRTIKVWITNGQGLYTLSRHTNSVHAVAFSPDGRLLASASGGEEEGADWVIALWEVPSWRVLHLLTGHTKSVNSVAFSPDGQLLASGSANDSITLWEVASGRELGTLSHHGGWFLKYPLNAIAFSPDGRLLASGSGDSTIKLWEVPSWRVLHLLTGHTKSVNSVTFSPDGQLLASGSADNTIRLWEVAGGREFPSTHTLTGHTKSVNSVAFSPDGRLLASGSADNTIKLWQ